MKAARDAAVSQCARAAWTASASPTAASPAPLPSLSPSDLLTRAYIDVKSGGEVEAGSTTACIVTLTRVPVTVPTQLNAETELLRRKALATAAQAAKVAQAAAADMASADQAAATWMQDIAAAVSAGSESMVASAVGIEQQVTTTAVASTMSADVTATDMAVDTEAPADRPVSSPIAIPQPAQATSVLLTIADASPEPATAASPPLLPSGPALELPAAAAPISAVAPAAPAAAAAAPPADELWLSAANLGDSGYLILRKDASGLYRIVTASDLQRR